MGQWQRQVARPAGSTRCSLLRAAPGHPAHMITMPLRLVVTCTPVWQLRIVPNCGRDGHNILRQAHCGSQRCSALVAHAGTVPDPTAVPDECRTGTEALQPAFMRVLSASIFIATLQGMPGASVMSGTKQSVCIHHEGSSGHQADVLQGQPASIRSLALQAG